MGYYTIENEEGQTYKNLLFENQSSAEEVAEALMEKFTNQHYWVTPLTLVGYVGGVNGVINAIKGYK